MFFSCKIEERHKNSFLLSSGIGGTVPPRDFPVGNFCRLICKNEARKTGQKMVNVEESEEKGKREGRK